MPKPNVYLLEPKLKWYQEVLGFIAKDDKVRDPDLRIFAPEKFILGPFKKRSSSILLDQNRMYYNESPEILENYKKGLEKNMLKVVKSVTLSESELENIVNQFKDYFETKKEYLKIREKMNQKTESITDYFQKKFS